MSSHSFWHILLIKTNTILPTLVRPWESPVRASICAHSICETGPWAFVCVTVQSGFSLTMSTAKTINSDSTCSKLELFLKFCGSVKLQGNHFSAVRKISFYLKPSLNLCPKCPSSLEPQGPDQQWHKQIHRWWQPVDEPTDIKQAERRWQNDWNRNCHIAWRKGERNIMRNQVKEEKDGEGKDRSWWTDVGLFTSRISLFSRCLAAHRGKGRKGEGQGRRRESHRRMWVIGGLVAVARLDSSWCILWLAHSKCYVVGNQESVVGMHCHGIIQETNTRLNNEESNSLENLKKVIEKWNETNNHNVGMIC